MGCSHDDKNYYNYACYYGKRSGPRHEVKDRHPVAGRVCLDAKNAGRRRQKVWIPDNDTMILEAVKAFGITPFPLSIADVRAGLQTGLINTVTTPPIGAVALQWHTQINYLMYEPFLYIYGVLAVDRRAFAKILPDDQRVFRKIMERIFREIDQLNRKDNVNALKTLRNQGIKFIKPLAEALDIWHHKAEAVPKRLVNAGKLSQGMVNTLETLLKECRLKQLCAEK
jgi:TRAP-type transport system periplasmic protein